jgi:signal transduction histidine kinase
MKNRQKFQIFDGFLKTSGQPMLQPAPRVQGIHTDIAEAVPCLLSEQGRGSLATALAASEQRLSNLLHDRSRIGRELHDSVLQALYTISLTLEQAPGLRQGATQVVACSHEQATNQLRTLIQDIRRMILSMESDDIVPFRLALELQALAQTVERASELRIRVWSDPAAEEVLTGEEAQELVIIAREALNNCVRHARATRVVIALQRIGSRVRLSICDNGSGFNVEHRSTKGIGFAQMEDRLRKIGGRLHVQSTVGQGTDIAADVYLEPILTTV